MMKSICMAAMECRHREQDGKGAHGWGQSYLGREKGAHIGHNLLQRTQGLKTAW